VPQLRFTGAAQAEAARHGWPAATDDAALLERIGLCVTVFEGDRDNIKITTAADLRLASAILAVLPRPKREGPAHPFADEQAMWGPTQKPKDLFP